MEEEALSQQVLHLQQVEKLSQRQIAAKLNIGRKRVKRILQGSDCAQALVKKSIFDQYRQLVAHWYHQYPRLKAIQIYQRLQEYGYGGSYASVVRLSLEYRKPQQTAYHPLTFLPGEEGQVDWFFFNHEKLGQVAGFVYILSFSRYAWGIFYPRTTFEFFLAGHLECFKHLGGLAHCHRYDNLKSVVLKRTSVITYNPQFLDFARFYGFSIYACNPYSGNEKGRVERLIRDIRTFLYGETFVDRTDLNRKFHLWLGKRNTGIHRSTGKTPKDLLSSERLIQLPQQSYPPRRIIAAVVSKTALVECDTNTYSVPSTCAGKIVDVAVFPDHIEISLAGRNIATHQRSFGKKQSIQNPLHAQKLLNQTPQFKMQRIRQLIDSMDPAFHHFLNHQEDDAARMQAAYELFCLLRNHAKMMIISAVRELNTLGSFKIKALRSLLHLPEPKDLPPLFPQNANILNLTYQERSLTDYDPDSTTLDTP